MRQEVAAKHDRPEKEDGAGDEHEATGNEAMGVVERETLEQVTSPGTYRTGSQCRIGVLKSRSSACLAGYEFSVPFRATSVQRTRLAR